MDMWYKINSFSSIVELIFKLRRIKMERKDALRKAVKRMRKLRGKVIKKIGISSYN